MIFDSCLVASCVVTELKDTVAVSSSSLNSENPYATIKDLPGLPFCPPESSYMEMKSAVPRERAYTEISPPPFNTATLRRGEQLFRPPSVLIFLLFLIFRFSSDLFHVIYLYIVSITRKRSGLLHVPVSQSHVGRYKDSKTQQRRLFEHNEEAFKGGDRLKQK